MLCPECDRHVPAPSFNMDYDRCRACVSKMIIDPPQIKTDDFKVGTPVVVHDNYRFAIPLLGVVITNTGTGRAEVELRTSNAIDYPIGCGVWVHTEQLRPQSIASHVSDDCIPEGVIKHDQVNQPPHYTQHPSGVECIQITEHMGFNLGNALKHIWRADLKDDAVEDMRKAIFYLNREIAKRCEIEQESV